MRWKTDTPADTVFSSAIQIAEDMVCGVDEVIEDLVSFDKMFNGMIVGLDEVKGNLKKHILKNKLTTKASKDKARERIVQIDNLMKTCKKFSGATQKSMDKFIIEMERFEMNPHLEEIINDIEFPPEESC